MPWWPVDSTSFHSLSVQDRRRVLKTAAAVAGPRAYLLEKDTWVVQTLSVLFEAPFGADLVFKGGTSLSKAYRAIRRFSEDVDVTYDIRSFVPELAGDAGDEALPRHVARSNAGRARFGHAWPNGRGTRHFRRSRRE